MSTPNHEVEGVVLITAIALIGKLIEAARPLIYASDRSIESTSFTEVAYECFNFHLHLSLGMLGLLWTQNAGPESCIILILMVLAGVLAKGLFSKHKPDRLSMSDHDALRGLYIPNAFAFACVIFVTYQLHFATAEAPSKDSAANQEHVVH